MNKTNKTIIFLFAFFFFAIAPALALGAGLVPCGGENLPSCQLCHFMFLVRNVTDFIVKVLVPLGILLIIIGAIIILVSRGTRIATIGKKYIRKALFAIIIAVIAWFVIDAIIVLLLKPGLFPFPWYAWDLQCPIVKISLPNAMTSSYDLITDTDPQGISPGDTIRYTLTYTNTSDINLSNLVIVVDYDQNQIASNSISNISGNGTDDNDKITWNIGGLNSQQSTTVSYNFVLTTDFTKLLTETPVEKTFIGRLLEKIIKPAFGQISPFLTVYYHNTITISSKEAEKESMNDPLTITLRNTIYAKRIYYLIKDIAGDYVPTLGDGLRYNISYFNPTIFGFANVTIISDYDQTAITITKIDGGGTDNGDKVVWNLGNLPAGQPTMNNPGCIGYNFTISGGGTRTVWQFIDNMFYIMANNGVLETRDDTLRAP
jgi:hypothetical protein